ncbi:MAG: MFS transporter [Clostridia bacterium]|nr:MAG: MFS transporter [Clostridia bacterium]
MTTMTSSYWKKLLYAFGMFGVALSYQAFTGWIQFYYLDVLRLAPAAMSIAWVIFTLWNMLNDPIAGQISDNTRTRWGRRIPWIVALSFPLGISFYLLWAVPVGLVGKSASLFSGLWWYFLAVLLAFDTLWSAITINYVALFPEMYPGQGERASVSAWRQAFTIVALILAITFTKDIAENIGWAQMGILFGSLTALAFLISLLGSREKPAATTDEPSVSLKEALQYTLRSRSFLWFVFMNLMVEFSLLALPAVVPLYAKYVLGETEGLRQGLLSGAAFIVAIPAFAFWTWAAKRWGTRLSVMASMALFGLLLLPLLVVQTYTQAIITTASLGVGLAGLLMLRDIMLADVIDEDSLAAGVRREGMYFGMNGFIIRLAFAFQGSMLGGMLMLSGYDPTLATQPPNVALGLRVLITLAPMAAMAVGIFAVYHYPLHGQRLAFVKAQIGCSE